MYTNKRTARIQEDTTISAKMKLSVKWVAMVKVLRYSFLFAISGCLWLVQPLMAAAEIEGNLVNVRWLEKNLKNADGTPKAAKDIWNILDKAGVPRYAELVCFSDDPGEAAVNYFILKLMGYPDIKVLVI